MDADTFSDLSEDLLADDTRIRFEAHGTSMLPAIRDGDVLVVARVPRNKLRIGDVVFARTQSGGVVTHRLMRRLKRAGKNVLILRGDNAGPACEAVDPERVLGRVERLERGDRAIRLDGPGQRWLALRAVLGYAWMRVMRRLVRRKELPTNLSREARDLTNLHESERQNDQGAE